MDVKIWMVSLIIMFAVHPICTQDAIFKKSSVSPAGTGTILWLYQWEWSHPIAEIVDQWSTRIPLSWLQKFEDPCDLDLWTIDLKIVYHTLSPHGLYLCHIGINMMTSSNGNIFRVTGPLCGEFTGRRWIPNTQRPVTRSFDVFCDLRLNKRLSKQPWGWWFEMPSWSLWRQCNESMK